MIRNALPASADPASAASPIFFGLIFEGVPALPAKAVTKNRPSHCARQTLADLGLTWVLRGALAGVGLRQRPAPAVVKEGARRSASWRVPTDGRV
jgi:hypothetical protein